MAATTDNNGIPIPSWGPASTATAVTPSDATDLTGTRALWVGTGGTVVVRMVGAPSTTVTFAAVPDGTLLPLFVTRVMAATGASNIVALA